MRYVSRLTGKMIKFKNRAQYEAHLKELRDKGLLKIDRSRKLHKVTRSEHWNSQHDPLSVPIKRYTNKPVPKPSGHVRQKISLIHPSWGRPYMCKQCIYMWMDMFSEHNDLEYILSLDTDDAKAYLPVIRDLVGKLDLKVVIYPNANMVHALNNAAKLASGDVLIYVSDDFECFDNYDLAIQKAVGKETDWVLFVYDGVRDDDVQTISILSKEYYDRFGYIYYPEYTSMWADPDYTEMAKRTGKVIDAMYLTFQHRHFIPGAFYDATYQRQDSPVAWDHGEKLFYKRAEENFGVK